MKPTSIREELVHAREMLSNDPDWIVGMTPLVRAVYDKLETIIARLDNLPAVVWSIAHDENGAHGIITREPEHAQNWRDAEHTSDDDILALYPLDIKQ